MPKIKPLLLFIIASIALHWWVLSLPIFQRIQLLEKPGSTNNVPTIVAKISNNQELSEPTKRSGVEASNQENLGTTDQSQQLPAPSFLRGSPWLRRPAENRSRNVGAQPPMPVFTQVENLLQSEAVDPTSNLQCKRAGIERLFVCQGSNNIEQSEKISRALNQIGNSLAMPIPNCIEIEALEKKWHAKACHS